jgi:hypothetical protein
MKPKERVSDLGLPYANFMSRPHGFNCGAKQLATIAPRAYSTRVISIIFIAVFGLSFAYNALTTVIVERNQPPFASDACEHHNLAWNLAHGRGFRYDRNEPAIRSRYEAHNSDGYYDFILARRGGHTTAGRPPFLPLLAAPVVLLAGNYDFIAWRVIEAVFSALAISICTIVSLEIGGLVAAGLTAIFSRYDSLREGRSWAWMTEGTSYLEISVLIWLMTKIAIAPRRWHSVGMTCSPKIGPPEMEVPR